VCETCPLIGGQGEGLIVQISPSHNLIISIQYGQTIGFQSLSSLPGDCTGIEAKRWCARPFTPRGVRRKL
jgi:hypothetical protein